MSSRKNSFLTPCRQVGLKRKSLGSTPPNAGKTFEPHRLTQSSVDVVNDNTKSQNTPDPPPKVSVSCNQSSPFEQRRMVPKRFKRTVIPPATIFKTDLTLQNSNQQSPTTDKEKQISSPTSFQSSSVSSVELSTHQKYDELSLSDIQLKVDEIKKRISAKQIQIENLQSQSANAKQHDLQTLNSLIMKWRKSCQSALNELVCELGRRNRPCSIPDLLKSIGIPAKLVRYSDTEMDFHEWYILIIILFLTTVKVLTISGTQIT